MYGCHCSGDTRARLAHCGAEGLLGSLSAGLLKVPSWPLGTRPVLSRPVAGSMGPAGCRGRRLRPPSQQLPLSRTLPALLTASCQAGLPPRSAVGRHESQVDRPRDSPSLPNVRPADAHGQPAALACLSEEKRWTVKAGAVGGTAVSAGMASPGPSAPGTGRQCPCRQPSRSRPEKHGHFLAL